MANFRKTKITLSLSILLLGAVASCKEESLDELIIQPEQSDTAQQMDSTGSSGGSNACPDC
ncbi:MAG: hypothetical protein AAGA66_11065 [Bacteroidota bacterium]